MDFPNFRIQQIVVGHENDVCSFPNFFGHEIRANRMLLSQDNQIFNIQNIHFEIWIFLFSIKVSVIKTAPRRSLCMTHVELDSIILFLGNFWMNAQLVTGTKNAYLYMDLTIEITSMPLRNKRQNLKQSIPSYICRMIA